MSLEAKTLYQELVLEHGKHPRNMGPLASATASATKTNPLCGDRVTVHLRIADPVLDAVMFEARGCMIARASASLLTLVTLGMSVAAAEEAARWVVAMAHGSAEPAVVAELESLRGVQQFPARRACVTLAWMALLDLLLPLRPVETR